jgi:hypothetical protein
MTDALWIGIAWGAGLALLYGAASLFTHRLALRTASNQQFLQITIGGLLLRMTAALALVAVTVGATNIHTKAFMGSFFGVFVLTLTLEVVLLHRHAGG